MHWSTPRGAGAPAASTVRRTDTRGPGPSRCGGEGYPGRDTPPRRTRTVLRGGTGTPLASTVRPSGACAGSVRGPVRPEDTGPGRAASSMFRGASRTPGTRPPPPLPEASSAPCGVHIPGKRSYQSPGRRPRRRRIPGRATGGGILRPVPCDCGKGRTPCSPRSGRRPRGLLRRQCGRSWACSRRSEHRVRSGRGAEKNPQPFFLRSVTGVSPAHSRMVGKPRESHSGQAGGRGGKGSRKRREKHGKNARRIPEFCPGRVNDRPGSEGPSMTGPAGPPPAPNLPPLPGAARPRGPTGPGSEPTCGPPSPTPPRRWSSQP